MRLAFAIPWRDLGSWLFEDLSTEHTGELLLAVPEPKSGGSRLPPYLAEFFCLWRRKYRLANYDTIFTWELRCALAILLLRRLQRSQTPVIVVGPILKGGILTALPLIRLLLTDATKIVCFSSLERDEYAALLRLPAERFVFLPTPYAASGDVPLPTDGGYALEIGRAHV